MERIYHFFDLLGKSNIALIGYSFHEERIKDELISKIPYIEIKEVDSSFSFISIIRDIKIDQIIDVKESNRLDKLFHFKWILLDISNISPSTFIGEKQKVIRNLISEIKDEALFNGYKLLITCPMYNKPTDYSTNSFGSFTGGSGPLYISDLVFKISENENNLYSKKKYKLDIIKNRLSDITSISLDGLENYNYLCDDYPHFINKNNEISY